MSNSELQELRGKVEELEDKLFNAKRISKQNFEEWEKVNAELSALKDSIARTLTGIKSKQSAFIGNRQDNITSANADGFKEGLSWAIDSIEAISSSIKGE